ncbi:hypothetical protein K2173_014426 [Erythroxylum novogranatense]|uniref:Diacylglycerol O-acyltransferase n=1 Tax=Erythroxylum novogranatense TaxID=1862640 RepID=A0AAV8S641_9ROSI|nr:hypothetical protein K2173_014426 [Erythroxylum novogranatense]
MSKQSTSNFSQYVPFTFLGSSPEYGMLHLITEIDIDRHIIVVEPTTKDIADDDGSYHLDVLENNDDAERIVNDYLADLSVSTPLSEDKPLWELHLLLEQNCIILRIHHALGDGISLMSLFLAACGKAEDPTAAPTVVRVGRRGLGLRWSGYGWIRALLGFLKMVLFSFVFCMEFVTRGFWHRDRKTVISGELSDGLRLTGLAMVNLRDQPGLQDMSELMTKDSRSRWGNRFGMLLLPVYYQKGGVDPLEYVKRAKKVIDRKKRSLEAHFSYYIGYLIMSWLGSKATCILNYRVICNTSFTISNVVGPKEEIIIGDNPVTSLRVNVSSTPHALIMHMVSYAGRADLQISVAKDIIPDPEFLAKCFEGALLEMKEAAIRSALSNSVIQFAD